MYPLHPGHAGSHEALIAVLAVVVVATALVLAWSTLLAGGAASTPAEG